MRTKNRALSIALAFLLVFWAGSSLYAFAQTVGARQPSNMIVAPARGTAAAGVVRFVALGDMGTGKRAQFAVARGMTVYHGERPYDTALMLGDNIYPQGSASDFREKFELPYGELLRRGVRFYASLGNHDVRRGREAQVNYNLFNMGGRSYYSFTKGDDLVEFFALDSTRMDDEQLRWLADALQNSKARWKLAFFHHPLYSSGKRHGSSENLRTRLEPLFVSGGVAAVFSGHDHVYERTRPQRGVQYFVSGAGGKLRRGNINRRSALFAAGNDAVNSFMYVEVTEDRINFWAVDANGNLLDGGALRAPGEGQPQGVEKSGMRIRFPTPLTRQERLASKFVTLLTLA
ncbi:MAG: metallophosphoesterase [Acidobacteriota bacterium]|nr:metallophosphoesterase [Acidobacteriota bacterium]